ncbi:MAG: FecR domain-containing protein, partial [Candidatus Aminicenantes bacterium]|nr:FecR domain-containing protein [Candidatus Aminicenantes bacterium]
MKLKSLGILSLWGIFVIAVSLSASDNYKIVDGPRDFYYGHISFTETGPEGDGPVILREGRTAPEPAVLNAPLGPGDIIRTTDVRRCEVQFDTGTIVRLDVSTELKIETICARSLSRTNGISNLALTKGRVYIMYKEYDSREIFQVLTANAAVRMNHNTVAMIKA